MSRFYNLTNTNNNDSSDDEYINMPPDRILGENGTALLVSTGNKLLDIFSKSTRLSTCSKNTNSQNSNSNNDDDDNEQANESANHSESFDKTPLLDFINKLDDVLSTESMSLDDIKYFVANGFYMRDVTEKGERTLFYLFIISLWNYDNELCKKTFKFIVGNEDSESYFGSWKDLTQILLVAKKVDFDKSHPDKYSSLYNFVQKFICSQLQKDWANYLSHKANQQISESRPKVSLCAKWLLSSDKSLDSVLSFDGKDFVANFCANNADAIVSMNKLARDLTINDEWHSQWKKVKTNDYIGLQRALRKIKSNLNEYLGTVEVLECANKWSEIKISSVPAKHMTKRRRAFNNEKSAKDREESYYDNSQYPFGDKFDKSFEELIANELMRSDLQNLVSNVSKPEYKTMLAEFKANYGPTIELDKSLEKVVDRILCRINMAESLVKADKKIHGARSDINDLVKAALNFGNVTPLDPSKIDEWAPSNPERALLHKQMDDKIREISEAIDQAMKVEAEAAALGESDIASEAKKVYINLKKTVGLYDVSGSMESGYGTDVRPIDVCIGLAYCISKLTADTTNGRIPFGITFHETPSVFTLPQSMDFVSACFNIKGQAWGGSTNFEAAFRLILDRAVRENWTQSDMPEVLMVISDMQFNVAGGRHRQSETMFETVEREFKARGFNLPLLVFWNVNGSYAGQNVSSETQGVISISGYDPALMKTIAECGSLVTKDKTGKITAIDPMEVMINALSRPKFTQLLETVTVHYADKVIEPLKANSKSINLVQSSSDDFDANFPPLNDTQPGRQAININDRRGRGYMLGRGVFGRGRGHLQARQIVNNLNNGGGRL